VSKCSVLHMFLIEHEFSNYMSYCRFVVISVAFMRVVEGGGRAGAATISESDGETCSLD
jgi:hypothetical protein